jgi:hypothetical protein
LERFYEKKPNEDKLADHKFSPEDESRLFLKQCEYVLVFSDNGKSPGTD